MLPDAATPPSYPQPSDSPPAHPVLTVILLIGVGGWAVALSVTAPIVDWLIEQSEILLEVPIPVWIPALVSAILPAIGGTPSAIVATASRRRWVRAIAGCWTLAAAAATALGLARAFPTSQYALHLGIITLIAAALIGVISWRTAARRRAQTAHTETGSSPTGDSHNAGSHNAGYPQPHRRTTAIALPLAVVVAGGLVVLVPWLWLGALGSVSTTLMAVLTAAALGALVAVICETTVGRTNDTQPVRRWVRLLLGPLVMGVALTIIGSATATPGLGMLLPVALPPAALGLAALTPITRRLPLGAALVGLTVLGPLATVHPYGLTVVLGLADIGGYAVAAAVITWFLLWLISGALAVVVAITVKEKPIEPVRQSAPAGFVTPPYEPQPAQSATPPESRTPESRTPETRTPAGVRAHRWIAGCAVLVAVAALGITAGVAGRPGFHGDRVFVIMASQANFAGIPTTGDPIARRERVFRRLIQHARTTQRPLLSALAGKGIGSTPYYLVNAIEVSADDPVTRAWLSGRDDVAAVLDSPRPRPIPGTPQPMGGSQSVPPNSPQWNITAIGADRAWADGARGKGIVVGSSDSGVDVTHPALAAGFRGGDDSWYDPWYDTRKPRDLNGHGTHTTATAVGRLGVGVAPEAKWIGCTNLARNLGNPARYTDCLQFMFAPHRVGTDPFSAGNPRRGADVLNNSWGCTPTEGCTPESLSPALRALRAAGVFVAASAGNTGPSCRTIQDPPALYDEAFTVGAIDSDRRVGEYSSRGPVTSDHSGRSKPDVVAPGTDILSALPGGQYGTLTGTSMSGPHVAGAVALIWSANPRLRGNIDTTERILRESADARDLKPTYAPGESASSCGGTRNLTGAGLINTSAAVTAARTVK